MYIHIEMLGTTAMQEIRAKQVPPHELRLKVGDVCLIMRNLNVEAGLTNNTRVQIVQIRPRCIKVQTLRRGHEKVFLIPRIQFKFRMHNIGFEITRTQFPLRRAFAMTYNKSQGQTLQKVVLDVRSQVFSHGMLYVGLSRVTNSHNIAIFGNKLFQHFDQNLNTMVPTAMNIVYPEMVTVTKQ